MQLMNSKKLNVYVSKKVEGLKNMKPDKQKKHSSINNGNSPHSLDQTFFAEIKQSTGLTHEDISELLDTDAAAKLGPTKISQFLNGHQSIGIGRLLKLAKRAKELKWDAPSVQMLLDLDEMGYLELMDKASQNIKKKNIGERQSEKRNFAALKKSVLGLVQSEWDVQDLVCMVIFLAQIFNPKEEYTSGGFVDPARMTNMLGGDSTNEPDMLWLTWRFMSLGEVAQELASESDKDMAVKAKTTTKSKVKPTEKSKSKTGQKTKTAKKSPAKRSAK